MVLTALLSGCEPAPSNPQTETWPLVKHCNLHQQACTTQYQGKSLTLNITPKPIPVAKTLQVQVTLNKPLTAKSLQIDISGHNMYMGYNRVSLQKTQPQHWQGHTMLAFCTTEKMQWILTLILETPDGQQIKIPFFLETQNR